VAYLAETAPGSLRVESTVMAQPQVGSIRRLRMKSDWAVPSPPYHSAPGHSTEQTKYTLICTGVDPNTLHEPGDCESLHHPLRSRVSVCLWLFQLARNTTTLTHLRPRNQNQKKNQKNPLPSRLMSTSHPRQSRRIPKLRRHPEHMFFSSFSYQFPICASEWRYLTPIAFYEDLSSFGA
jgi:hypothetical protein